MSRNTGEKLNRNEKGREVRHQNVVAAKFVADAIRTSLGPRGMDKMIQDGKGGVIITNDGATILREMSVVHPAAKMLVELSKAQDIEAGDGTTSVVVLAGSLLSAAETLLDKGVHPQMISDCFLQCAKKAEEILRSIAIPVDLNDRSILLRNASTSLCSKVVSQSASLLSGIAVDSVMKILGNQGDKLSASNVDLRDIRIVKKLGGTVDDTELVEGLVFVNQKVSRAAGGPTHIQNAKIGLIQFCISPPKTDMENNIIIKDYTAMDRLLREERLLTAKMVKQIAATGCNVLLIQKSILRDAVSDLALDYLAKAKILVVKDIERDDIESISKALCCQPIASLDHFTADKLGSANSVSDEQVGSDGRVCKITGIPGEGLVTIFLRASNQLMLDETERSLHDALCVVRCLVKERALVPGGGSVESHLFVNLIRWANSLSGIQQLCVRAYAEALEVIPYTLAENAGLDPIQLVTELRNLHATGQSKAGISVRKSEIADMSEENVVQPLLVSLSTISLATETVMMILKIDDIVLCM